VSSRVRCARSRALPVLVGSTLACPVAGRAWGRPAAQAQHRRRLGGARRRL